jgi:superfamily II DNA or RNA helicase
VDIRIVVDNRLRLRRDDLPAGVESELRHLFTHPNPEYSKKRAMGFSTFGVPTQLQMWRLEGGEFSLPRGGTKKVRVALENAGARARFVDRRVCLDEITIPRHRIVLPNGSEGALRDYQVQAIEAMVKRENCLLRAPTGSGKTSVALALIARVRQPSLVVLWSKNLFNQWRVRLDKELNLTDIGVIQGGRWKIRPVTLAMQQSLWSREEQLAQNAGRFGLVLVDEVQRAAARTLREVIDAFPARYRIGISADETRKDKLECLTRDLFGEVAADIPLEDLVEEGAVHDVEIRVCPTDFRADWYHEEKNWGKLLEEMGADETRNELALCLVKVEASRGETVLAFAHRREHARWMADEALAGLGCGLLLGGEESSVRFEEDRKRLLRGQAKIAVGTVQAIGQGLDLPTVSRGVAVTPIASNRQLFGQVRGRICRTSEGKKDAILYVLWDQHVFPDHLYNIVKWNRTVKVQQGERWIAGKQFLRSLES